MSRSPCSEKGGLKKGPWTPEEDQRLLAYIEEHGHGCWRALPAKAGLQRCGKSCRLRWTNYLRPGIKRGMFSMGEEQTIVQLHALLGNRWSAIASHLPKRTDNEIKNFWNTHLKRRLAKMGIDPVTHKPTCDTLSPADCHASTAVAAHLSHLAQWESARLEAEVRLASESKLLCFASSSSLAAADSTATSSVPSATTPFQLPLLSSVPPAPVELHNASTAPALPSCSNVLRAWEGVWKRSTRGSIVDGQSSQDAKIDLESPTSRLSFSESVVPLGAIGLVDHHNSSSVGRQAGGYGDGSRSTGRGRGEMEGEDVDRKYFLKSMQLFDTKERLTDQNLTAASFTAEYSSSAFGTNNVSSWLHEWLKMGPSSAAASSVGHFADEFTETLLLNNSEEEKLSGRWAAELAVTKTGKRVNV